MAVALVDAPVRKDGGLESLLEIPPNASFKLCSSLKGIDTRLRNFFREFFEHHATYESDAPAEQSRYVASSLAELERIFDDEAVGNRLDYLVMYIDGEPVGAQGFRADAFGDTIDAEGLFVMRGARGNRYAPVLREVLFSYLRDEGFAYFVTTVADSETAQGMARHDQNAYGTAIRNPELDGSKILYYELKLDQIKPQYNMTEVGIA